MLNIPQLDPMRQAALSEIIKKDKDLAAIFLFGDKIPGWELYLVQVESAIFYLMMMQMTYQPTVLWAEQNYSEVLSGMPAEVRELFVQEEK